MVSHFGGGVPALVPLAGALTAPVEAFDGEDAGALAGGDAVPYGPRGLLRSDR